MAAERSAVTARRRRDEWLRALEEVEASWRAYEAADAAARRVEAAAVLPEPRTPRTPAEYADRERYLHRAAMAACCRKELSVLQLSDALAHRNGWDPRRHPVEQEIGAAPGSPQQPPRRAPGGCRAGAERLAGCGDRRGGGPQPAQRGVRRRHARGGGPTVAAAPERPSGRPGRVAGGALRRWWRTGVRWRAARAG